ncbi:MAG: RNA polymerase sigma factor [Fimbriimonadaceae bacterium]|nr:MAG: RNA polymerase sigma factor, sigma-70 family [Armatimonadetes bacterium OLB18]WKZ80765.1 MAG: RNA polymerase sigma factor [Fimbriimonadaceae bacterium]
MDADLQQALSGNREAMARIVDEHYDSVFRFCARRIGTDGAADAAQETFVTAQQRIRGFRGHSSLRTWLLGIALNHCRNLSRKLGPQMARFHPFEDETGDPSSVDPTQVMIERETLRSAFEKLSEDHKEVVLLHEVEGLTYDEAAHVLGVPAGTVKSRLHHAFQNLRASLCDPQEANS